jgi:hypothetical protein
VEDVVDEAPCSCCLVSCVLFLSCADKKADAQDPSCSCSCSCSCLVLVLCDVVVCRPCASGVILPVRISPPFGQACYSYETMPVRMMTTTQKVIAYGLYRGRAAWQASTLYAKHGRTGHVKAALLGGRRSPETCCFWVGIVSRLWSYVFGHVKDMVHMQEMLMMRQEQTSKEAWHTFVLSSVNISESLIFNDRF